MSANAKIKELAQQVRATAKEIGYGVDDLLWDLVAELGIQIEFPNQD